MSDDITFDMEASRVCQRAPILAFPTRQKRCLLPPVKNPAINAGLKSRRQVISERGDDAE